MKNTPIIPAPATQRISAHLGAWLLVGLMTTSLAYASGRDCGKSRDADMGAAGNGRMEQMFERLDLTKEQEQKIEAIMDRKRAEKSSSKERKAQRREAMKEMHAISPDDPQYEQKVKAQADKMAAAMAEKMVRMAMLRKEVHAVLTPEQRTKMQQQMEEKAGKAKKRASEHDHQDSDD